MNLTDKILGNAISGKVSSCAGFKTDRDFQVGIEMAWHGGTILIDTKKGEKITREFFPDIGSRPMFFGDYAPEIKLEILEKKNPKLYVECGFDKLAEAIKKEGKLILGHRANDYCVPISADDGKISGAPFDDTTYTLFDGRKAFDFTTGLLDGTKYSVESLGMLWDRTTYFITFSLDELKAMNLGGHKWLLGVTGGTDRMSSPTWNLSNVRMVCANTVRASLASGSSLFSQKLTKDFLPNLNAKKMELEKVVGVARIWNETYKAIESKEASQTMAIQAYAGEIVTTARKTQPDYKLIREKTSRAKATAGAKSVGASTRAEGLITELTLAFAKGDGNKGKTRADILNGFTQVMTRGTAETTKAPWKQWQSSEFGLMADRKETFFATCADDVKFEEMRKTGELALAGN